ncbi:hypothetical protein P154DRAFT_335338 [Amniculicola lignicola CBS 123094]|uniref:Uncharacterized protein n=1 Tax=Amniculicola lignicola CBS 123094 TaxID=1392246 RepID=A0A6A5W3G2_9PLEO|nr:hypothetical protein P154DRAFT_335338 [Amniculicola lignicola CBS 123094]
MYIEVEMWLVGAWINMTGGPGSMAFFFGAASRRLVVCNRWMVSWFVNVVEGVHYV